MYISKIVFNSLTPFRFFFTDRNVRDIFLIITLLTFPISNLYAQNLVPNGDFNISNCPTDWHQLGAAIGWYSPTIGTTDHFHRCGKNRATVPSNIAGYQEPFIGDGYADFVGAYIYLNTNRDTFYHQT
jgi:hypothetical protein